MPTYDYRCQNCAKDFELFLSLAERTDEVDSSEKKVCPFCSSKSIEPLMTFNGGILSSSSSCGPSGCPSGGGCSGGGCPFSS